MAEPARLPTEHLPRQLQRKLTLSRLAAVAEDLWPRLALPLVVAGAFVAAAWFGLFTALPRWWRVGASGAFILAFAAALWPLLRWRLPSLDQAGARLDLTDPALHRPLSTLSDAPAGDDPVARAIWQRHRARAEAAAAALAVPAPVSRLPKLDGFAVRGLTAFAVIAAAFVAGDERANRISDAFAWGEVRTPPVPPRLDAWIDPPAYTGRAPVFLSGANAVTGAVHVPAGSIAVIRVSPGDGVTTTVPPTLKEKVQEQDPARKVAAPTTNGPFEKRFVLDQAATIDVRRANASLGSYDIRTIPDMPPKVVFSSIEPEDKGAGLRLKFTLEDDFGVARSEALIARADGTTTRTLLPPPEILLGGRLGETESLLAAPEHPWAGTRVTIKLRATDDLGQVGESAALEATIPARRFENPVSRALVEQRRNIVLNPDNRKLPQVALDGLLVAPDRFTRRSGDYIMLSMAARKLRIARTDADLIALADYLWETAVAMDEGNLTNAERALRAAEERLREALERGAEQDEIRKLMDEMRQAMNEMLRELMERADRNADRNPSDQSQRNLTLNQRDLNDMLKRIEELYRQGDTARAQEMLRQLQELLNQMRSARRSQDPRTKEMGEALDELERLQREQEGLRDETFRNENRRRMGRNQQRPQQSQPGQQGQRGQRGQQGQQGDQGDEGEEGDDQAENGQGLTERQQALRDRLRQLRDKMRQQGAPSEEGMDGADEGMGDAEQNLRQGQGGRATQGQQRAIDELGRAGRALSQQMQREMGEGNEPGEGEGMGPGDPSGNQRNRADQRTDPLGRPLSSSRDQLDNSRGTMLNDKDNIRGSIGERAQRVLEELRRRFGEIERPREELEYIERLLRRN